MSKRVLTFARTKVGLIVTPMALLLPLAGCDEGHYDDAEGIETSSFRSSCRTKADVQADIDAALLDLQECRDIPSCFNSPQFWVHFDIVIGFAAELAEAPEECD